MRRRTIPSGPASVVRKYRYETRSLVVREDMHAAQRPHANTQAR